MTAKVISFPVLPADGNVCPVCNIRHNNVLARFINVHTAIYLICPEKEKYRPLGHITSIFGMSLGTPDDWLAASKILQDYTPWDDKES